MEYRRNANRLAHLSQSGGLHFRAPSQGLKSPAVPHDAELQPVDKKRTSF